MKFTNTDSVKENAGAVKLQIHEQINYQVHDEMHEHVVVQIWIMYHKIFWETRDDIH